MKTVNTGTHAQKFTWMKRGSIKTRVSVNAGEKEVELLGPHEKLARGRASSLCTLETERDIF